MTGSARAGSARTGSARTAGTTAGGPRDVVPGQRGPDGGSAATAVAARRTRGALDSARRALRGSPGQLRIAGIAAVLACLAFALLMDWGLQTRAAALSDARARAGQLVRVQKIASDLVAADSQFTNGYLTFGQDSPAALSSFDSAVQDASRLIAEAARAEPADADELARVNDALTRYTARVAAARANNRQGFQVGVGYLRQANVLLQTSAPDQPDLLPTLRRLADANSVRVDEAFAASRRATWMVTAGVLIGLVLLLAVQGWLALRTHRVINPPLAAGTAAVLLAALAGIWVMAAAQSTADRVKQGSYAATLALANGRIDAYTGKSYESITLIYIGTGGDFPSVHKVYQEKVASAKAQLARAAAAGAGSAAGSGELAKWTGANDVLYTQAQNDWTSAATKASSSAPGSVNALFADFDAVTGRALATQSAAVSDGLTGSHVLLVAIGWAALLLGIAAAVASWLGISLRLEEYR